MGTSSPIEAAGGLVWREVAGQPQVAVVHRDRYDDWSLPKGKVEPDETKLSAAIREVAEETGARVAVSRRLGPVRYLVGGVAKSVRYWAMRYLDGDFTMSDEVDQLRWLDVGTAHDRLSYAGERAVLAAFTRTPAPTSEIVVIRHAKAGKRSDWSGPDSERPLETKGRAQARALVDDVAPFAPVRILSADPVRCVQTVRPLGRRLGLTIEIDRSFSDAVCEIDRSAGRTAVAELARAGVNVAVCSQGDTMRQLLGQATGKGSAWVLGCRDGEIVSRDYYAATSRRRR